MPSVKDNRRVSDLAVLYSAADRSSGGTMPEKRVKAELAGVGLVDGFEVNVAESTERWTEIKLEDGSVLRAKLVIMGAIRLDGRYDQDGNPVYSLKIGPVMTVLTAPDHLRQPPKGNGAQKPN